jgi:hypothetical protein
MSNEGRDDKGLGEEHIDRTTMTTMTTIGIGGGDDKGGGEEQIMGTTMTTTIGNEGSHVKGGGKANQVYNIHNNG